MDEKKCLCGSSDVRVVACSGASNVGQIANQAALELASRRRQDFSAWRESERTSKEWSNPGKKRI